MMSDNYLFENWRCPVCHSHGPFYIKTKQTASEPDGAEGANWKGDSACVCSKCSHSATVADFSPLRQRAA